MFLILHDFLNWWLGINIAIKTYPKQQYKIWNNKQILVRSELFLNNIFLNTVIFLHIDHQQDASSISQLWLDESPHSILLTLRPAIWPAKSKNYLHITIKQWFEVCIKNFTFLSNKKYLGQNSQNVLCQFLKNNFKPLNGLIVGS